MATPPAVQDRTEHPLADFQARPERHLASLRASGEPTYLTVPGEPAVVVQDAAAYEQLLDRLDLLQERKLLDERLESARRGNVVPWEEVDQMITGIIEEAERKQQP